MVAMPSVSRRVSIVALAAAMATAENQNEPVEYSVWAGPRSASVPVTAAIG